MRLRLAISLPLLLAGCATGPSLQSKLAGYIGAPESVLVQQLGVPQRQIQVNGVNYLAYQVRYSAQNTYVGPYWGAGPYWGGPFWGPYGPLQQDVQIWSCEATFALKDDKVQSFSLRGNDCN